MKNTSKYLTRIIDIVGKHPNGIKAGAVGRIIGVSINVIYSAIASSVEFYEDDDDRLLLVHPVNKPQIIQPLIDVQCYCNKVQNKRGKRVRKKPCQKDVQLWLFDYVVVGYDKV